MNNTIDMEVVQELLDLCDDGDVSLIIDLVEMFLADGPDRIEKITTGLANGDLDSVEKAAHSLKGTSGNLGATELMNTAEALQNASRAGDIELSGKLGPQIRQHFDHAAVELGKLVMQLSSTA